MIHSEALLLYGAYRTVGAALRKTLDKGSGSKSKSKAGSPLAQVIRRITVDAAEGYKGVDEFLTSVREFLVLSLWVSARLPAGKQLLAALAAQPQALMTIDLRPKLGRSSLLAFVPPGHEGAYGRPDTSGNRVRVDGFDKAEPIIKGTGSSSRLGAPVWLPRTKDQGPHAPNAVDVAPDLFVGYVTVEEALIRILLGSVSFLQNRGVFYTPPRIELMHELIHVLHNASGTNREFVLQADFRMFGRTPKSTGRLTAGRSARTSSTPRWGCRGVPGTGVSPWTPSTRTPRKRRGIRSPRSAAPPELPVADRIKDRHPILLPRGAAPNSLFTIRELAALHPSSSVNGRLLRASRTTVGAAAPVMPAAQRTCVGVDSGVTGRWR